MAAPTRTSKPHPLRKVGPSLMAGLARMFRKPLPPPTRPIGESGTAIFGGYIQENERNADLTGDTKYITYSDILANCSIASAGVRLFLNLVSKASWKVLPGQGAGAERYAKLVEQMIHDMETPWNRVVRSSVMYKFYGFSLLEWTAKRRDDGVIGLEDVDVRPQKTIEKWDTDAQGNVLGVWQCPPQHGQEIYIPRSRLLYLVDDSLSDSPEGLGVFRQIVDPARRLQRFEALEGVGFETDLQGMPVARAPLDDLRQRAIQEGWDEATTSEQTAVLEDFIQNHIASNERGMLLDSKTYESQGDDAQPSQVRQWDIELLQSTPTTQSQVGPAIERLNREIARVLGVEQLLLGSDQFGSMALSRDKSKNFMLMLQGTLNETEVAATRDLIGSVGMLNGWDKAALPRLKAEPIQYRDVEEVTSALRDLAQAGAPLMPDDPAIPELRDILGISAPDMSTMEEDASLMRESMAQPEPAADDAQASSPEEGEGPEE